jgi:hypothetical protein
MVGEKMDYTYVMRIAIVPLVLLLLNTCTSVRSARQVSLGREFQLKFQEAALLDSEQIRILFRSILEDSRCPKEVQCIQAGKATIELELTNQKSESSLIQLSTDSNEITSERYRIKLIDVLPYPVSGSQIQPQQYVAILLITAE